MPWIIPLGAAAAGAAVAGSAVIAGVLGTWGAYALGTLVATGVSYLGQRLLGDTPQVDMTAASRGFLVNRASPFEHIPVVYGFRRIAGIRVFATVNSIPTDVNTDNGHLWTVFVFCEGPVEAVDQIYLDGVPINDPKFTDIPWVSYYVHLGEDTQAADSTLVDYVSEWTTNHRLQGLCYVAFNFVAKVDDNEPPWVGLPTVTADIRGRKVYDPRTMTTAHSSNPALCILDYLTNARYGKGEYLEKIDIASFNTAANYCDELVSTYGILFERRYSCNGAVDTSQTLFNAVQQLCTSCRGSLITPLGQYVLWIDKPETAASTGFDESNIIGGWRINLGSKAIKLNRIRATFYDPNTQWQPSVEVVDSPTYRTEDKGELLDKEIQLPFTISAYTANRIGQIEMNVSRERIACEFTATYEALQFLPGDVVPITHSTPGWAAKLFRIITMSPTLEGTVTVQALEYEAAAYTPTALTERTVSPNTNIPSIQTVLAPTSLNAASGTDELVLGSDGSIVSRIRVTWIASADGSVQRYEMQAKRSTSTNWIPYGVVTTTTAHIAPVQDGELYNIRVRALNRSGFSSPWLTLTDYPVIGKTQPPNDVDSFMVTRQPDGTREFTWSLTAPPVDLAGYKIRYSLGIGGVWGTMLPLHTGLLQSSPWETNQLAAGTYTVGIKAVDTSGNESVNAVLIESTLGDPRIKNSLAVVDARVNSWPGTKTNCFIDDEGALIPDSTDTWDTLPATWDLWTTWNPNPVAQMKYESSVIDAGAVAPFVPLVTVATARSIGTLTVEEKHSDDNITWSAYAAVTAGSQITSRYVQVRITVDNPPAGGLQSLQINLSADTTDEEIRDLNTSTLTGAYRIGVGDIRLPIAKPFNLITTVQLALQNVSAGWTWTLLDKDTTTGPRIKIYDGTGAAADCSIDAVVRGL